MSQVSAIETARQWVELAIPELTAVIYGEFGKTNSPRPTLPYAMVSWESDTANSTTPYEITNEMVDSGNPDTTLYYQNRYERRRGTLRVTFFGDSGFDYASELRLSLRRVIEKAHIRDNDIAITRASGIIDTTQLRDTKWEPSCFVDFYVSYQITDRNEVGIIETVTSNLTLDE